MATKTKEVAGGKVYKGSKQNGGRPIVVKHYKKNGKWHTTSENAARNKYQKKHGKLSKGTDVDHKDRKSTRLNSSHSQQSRMPSSA